MPQAHGDLALGLLHELISHLGSHLKPNQGVLLSYNIRFQVFIAFAELIKY